MRPLGKLLAAVVFGVVSFVAISPLAASLNATGAESSVGMWFGLAVFAAVALIILWAPTVRRAFGRGFLLSGVLLLALPLSATALSGVVAAEQMAEIEASGASDLDQAAGTAGTAIGAGLIVGAAAFIGLILEGIFVILGLVLVLGGRREVVVASPARPT